MPALHRPDEIFSRRHVPTWIMLTFAAGCVNAIAMVACEHFVTHVTGTVTKLGTELADLSHLREFVMALACFIGGAMASGMLINARVHRGKRPLYAAPLVVVAVTTAAVALAGHAGLLGMFGGALLDAGDFVLLSVLSFASGLQNAAVATSTGLLVRTTHLTGPATDLGIHLVEFVCAEGDVKRSAKRHALLRAGKIVAFAVGAASGVTLAHGLHFLAFLVPAAIVLVATALSFLHVPNGDRAMLRPPSPSAAAL
ncbi:hypothetical protein SOCE26_083340 [Sorangium cellulosum]|uniref:DUF1275 domain-containing protein n=1 Tax=Sorangium cellulosum TaxID=56 RepID=A0A2L0F5G7_SORCE|nr:hypothetical protein SOCE26_083340 [Sorangium cellulosum]